jgi:hypothetical protein
MSIRALAIQRQRNRVQFEELSRLNDLLDELKERRRQALELAQCLSADVPQRHKLMQLLEPL